MNLKVILQIIIIVILLGFGGVLVYDNFWNDNQIQEDTMRAARQNPLGKIIFSSSFSPGVPTENEPSFEYSGEKKDSVEEEIDKIIEELDPEKRGYQLTTEPIAGWTTFIVEKEVDEKETKIEEFVRYVRIEDGLVSEQRFGDNSSTQEIVDRFVPNVERVTFSEGGEDIIFQYFNYLINGVESYQGKIEEVVVEVSECPFSFPSRPQIDDTSDEIEDLHLFLARDPRTEVVLAEDEDYTIYTEKSDVAVKNFQTIYELDIDGMVGKKTITKMKEVCAQQQDEVAKEAQNNLEKQSSINGYFLPTGIYSLTKNPGRDEYFYLFKKGNESFGIVGNFDTTTTKQIFQSPLTELYAEWITNTRILIGTKPSYYAPGYIYLLNPQNEEFIKVVGGRNALYGKGSPDGKRIFLSYIDEENKLQNSVYNIEEKNEKKLVIKTFAEKCVWNDKSTRVYCGVPENIIIFEGQPDEWYQGIISFSDVLWEIDIEEGDYIEVPAFTETVGKTQIDIDMIDISESGDYIIFRNKLDETLWTIPLEE